MKNVLNAVLLVVVCTTFLVCRNPNSKNDNSGVITSADISGRWYLRHYIYTDPTYPQYNEESLYNEENSIIYWTISDTRVYSYRRSTSGEIGEMNTDTISISDGMMFYIDGNFATLSHYENNGFTWEEDEGDGCNEIMSFLPYAGGWPPPTIIIP